MSRRAPIAVVLTAVLWACGAGSVSAAGLLPTLYVTYKMNCTFDLSTDTGAPLTQVAPGRYQVLVTTPAPFALIDTTQTGDATACGGFAQFQLTGPGVNAFSNLGNGGDMSDLLDLTFQPSSTYTALDKFQPGVTRKTFTTAASGTPATPTSSPTAPVTPSSSSSSQAKKAGAPVAPLRGMLVATVSAAGKLTLTSSGQRVASLKSGRYTFSVVDRSKTSGFVLQEIGKAATTVAAAGFVGKRTVTITLKAGRWFFYPTFIGAKTFFVVTT